MSPESFTDLALRVIAREATDEEHRAIEAEVAASTARREEFEQLKISHEILLATVPMAGAVQATEPALPAHRVNELRTAVRQHFGPAAQRPAAEAQWHIWPHVLRWVFGGGGLVGLGFAVVMFCYANQTVEVGLYGSDLNRVRGYETLTPQDFSSARLVTFDQDAAFDAWQSQPLAWYEHAKIWVDNEHDLLHITQRMRAGQIVTMTQPLAPTDDGQREQIKSVVESLNK